MNTAFNLKILFLLIKSRINSKGEFPIYCKLTLNKTLFRFATGISLSENLWSQVKQQAIGNSPRAKSINLKLKEIVSEISSTESHFIKSQQEYTLQDIVNKLQNKNNLPFTTLIQAYNYRY